MSTNKCDETKNDIKDRNGSAESVIYTVPEVQFVVFFSGDISIKFFHG